MSRMGAYVEALVIIDSKWWPETGSNRRRRPFQGRLAMDLGRLESAEIIETKAVNACRFRIA